MKRRLVIDRWGLSLAASCLLLFGCRPLPAETPVIDRSGDQYWQGRLVLGAPSLTAGIPGEGPLTLAQVNAWLADPANHEPLEVALPLGLREPGVEAPIPADNSLTRAKIELGRQLFFEERMSPGTYLACGKCHHPLRQFAGDRLGHPELRETAVAINRLLSREQFWDGRAASLEEQVRFPVESPVEFNTSPEEMVAALGRHEVYRRQFEAIFGRLDFAAVCQAIASFERVLVTGPSPWDIDQELQRFERTAAGSLTAQQQAELADLKRAAAERPLSDSARRGASLFFSDRTRCSQCHTGPNFTDEQYYDIGLRSPPGRISAGGEFADDAGRFRVTGREADRYAFKTPTLRNVSLSWPYMHDARFNRVEDVVSYFVRGGDHAESAIEPLDLSPPEQRDLVEFLRALTGPLPAVARGRLPE